LNRAVSNLRENKIRSAAEYLEAAIIKSTPTSNTRINDLVQSFIDAKMTDGTTALILASQNGHHEVVQALIAAKANVNANSEDGATALIMASKNGHQEVVQTLINAKASVNAKARNGITALTMASKNGHLKVVQLPKNAGAIK
jgi:ankyrin repeat protein